MAVYSKTFIDDSCKRLMLLSYKKLTEIVTKLQRNEEPSIQTRSNKKQRCWLLLDAAR